VPSIISLLQKFTKIRNGFVTYVSLSKDHKKKSNASYVAEIRKIHKNFSSKVWISFNQAAIGAMCDAPSGIQRFR